MTNREWLYSLAQNDPHALDEWMSAEHNDDLSPENVVTSDEVYANDGNVDENSLTNVLRETVTAESVPQESLSDTREKLEADMVNILHSAYMYAWMHGHDNRRGGSFSHIHREFFNLLDRQAAMTERYWKAQVDALVVKGEELANKNAELQVQVDGLERELRKFKDMNNEAGEEIAELQSQLDEIAELVGWHGEVDGNSGESLLVPMVGAMCEGSEVAAKLKERVDELTAENAKLSSDELLHRAHVDTLRRENAELREKLGIALDHAHDLLSLVNLDGEVIS